MTAPTIPKVIYDGAPSVRKGNCIMPAGNT